MNHQTETTYNVMLPGSERICSGSQEVTQLLHLYLGARPDDPELARVKVYELIKNGNVRAGPLALDRFIPGIAQHSAS